MLKNSLNCSRWFDKHQKLSILITRGDLIERIKKSKLESIPEDQEPDITHGGLVIDTDEVIIEDDADKFTTLFKKTFVEQVGETEITDSEDGAVQDISAKIVLRIKQKLKDIEANGPGVRFLRLTTYFFQ